MFGFLKTSFQKIKSALKKTNAFFGAKLLSLFTKPLDENSLNEIEQVLYEADLGSNLVEFFIDHIKKIHRQTPLAKGSDYLKELQMLSLELFKTPPKVAGNIPIENMPQVILVVGVNGSGKTTSIAKMAKQFQDEGKKILLGAADTFRAAATEQLEIWSQKIGAEIVTGTSGGDPSSVLFDSMSKAIAKQYDIVICDTAGRLESKSDLMKELEKMVRVAKKQDTLAPHETYLVIDGSLGQTAVEQAKIFNQYVPLTGLILTKIDGSAKGGVALAIYHELGIPIKFIGTGEKIDDLTPFDAKTYTEALFYG